MTSVSQKISELEQVYYNDATKHSCFSSGTFRSVHSSVLRRCCSSTRRYIWGCQLNIHLIVNCRSIQFFIAQVHSVLLIKKGSNGQLDIYRFSFMKLMKQNSHASISECHPDDVAVYSCLLLVRLGICLNMSF